MATDHERLALILELIDLIKSRLANASLEGFRLDRDEIDLTAFRLAHVGELTNRLSDGLKLRHPEIPWRPIVAMRNIISHDYQAISPTLVWNASTIALAEFEAMCRAELGG